MPQATTLSAAALHAQADAFFDAFPTPRTSDQLLAAAGLYDAAACMARAEGNEALCRECEIDGDLCRVTVRGRDHTSLTPAWREFYRGHSIKQPMSLAPLARMVS